MPMRSRFLHLLHFVFVICPLSSNATRAKEVRLSDPAHEGARLQPERDGRVRCSAWLP